jgi:hypothetical protein
MINWNTLCKIVVYCLIKLNMHLHVWNAKLYAARKFSCYIDWSCLAIQIYSRGLLWYVPFILFLVSDIAKFDFHLQPAGWLLRAVELLHRTTECLSLELMVFSTIIFSMSSATWVKIYSLQICRCVCSCIWLASFAGPYLFFSYAIQIGDSMRRVTNSLIL